MLHLIVLQFLLLRLASRLVLSNDVFLLQTLTYYLASSPGRGSQKRGTDGAECGKRKSGFSCRRDSDGGARTRPCSAESGR